MDQSLAVPLVAFFCFAASVAVGMATHGRTGWSMALPAPPGMLVGLATALVALAALALGIMTVNARSDFHRAEAQAQVLAQDALALDEALRGAGAAGEAARTVLFRYADGIAQQLYGHRNAPLRPSAVDLAALRTELRAHVGGLAQDPTAVAVAAGRLEVLLRTGDDLLAMTPVPGLKWCRPILVAWLMVGLGMFALVAPPRLRHAVLLTGLAGVLSLGLFFLEEMANPFQGTFTVSRAILDDVLFTIAE